MVVGNRPSAVIPGPRSGTRNPASLPERPWIPAFAGMTARGTFPTRKVATGRGSADSSGENFLQCRHQHRALFVGTHRNPQELLDARQPEMAHDDAALP